MALYGYAKVTPLTNKTEQITILNEAGCEHIIIEDCTHRLERRVEFKKLIKKLDKEDVILVDDLSSLANSTSDLLAVVNVILECGAHLDSIKQPWIDTKSTEKVTPLDVINWLLEFERAIHGDRVKAGMEIAKKHGVVIGRPSSPTTKIAHAIEMYNSKEYTAKEIVAVCGISKSTLYRELRKHGLIVK